MKKKQPKQDARNVYARKWYNEHKEARKAAVKKCRAKKKMEAEKKAEVNKKAEEALDKLFVRKYQSPFDDFFVQLHVGPAELFTQAQPGVQIDTTGKSGGTVTTPDMEGVLVWLAEWYPTPEHICLLFHELTHAAVCRFEQDGIGKQGDVQAMNEFIAYSVGEFGRYFLEVLNAEFGAAAPDGKQAGGRKILMSCETFKAKVRLAWKARKDREDPERPEEFTREEVAKDEMAAVYRAVQWPLLCSLGEDRKKHDTGETVSWDEPFPLKGWDCVSFPMTGEIINYCGKPYNRFPSEECLSELCAERRCWLGIEVEFPDPLKKHAGAYAPDGSVMFDEDYDGEPPSFYAAVEEYWPVYAIKLAAMGLE